MLHIFFCTVANFFFADIQQFTKKAAKCLYLMQIHVGVFHRLLNPFDDRKNELKLIQPLANTKRLYTSSNNKQRKIG